MSELELKPCPFCGGEATISTSIDEYNDQLIFVVCKRCGGKGRECSTSFEGSSMRAVEWWNLRMGEDGC